MEATAETLIVVTMPQMGVSVSEGTVVEWRVAVGDRVERDQSVCVISTDKVDTELPAPTSGTVAEIHVAAGQTVPVETALARIATSDAVDIGAGVDDARERRDKRRPAEEEERARTGRQYVPTRSPVVQRMAAAHDLDLERIPGTGRGGRVTKRDILAYVEARATRSGELASARAGDARSAAGAPLTGDASSGAAVPMTPSIDRDIGAAPEVVTHPVSPASLPSARRLSRMRVAISEHMTRSLATAAHCHTFIEADMSRVETHRVVLGVSPLPIVARATVDALRSHPALNAWLEGDAHTIHSVVHLGIAVSLGEDGLIVPVVHNAHELSVEGLAARIGELVRRARARELSPDDVQGATFTITNLGSYGTFMSTPIINQPQVGILDLEAIVKRPVVAGDAIAIRPTTVLGLGWDHRALDGALAAQFLATLRDNLEQWD